MCGRVSKSLGGAASELGSGELEDATSTVPRGRISVRSAAPIDPSSLGLECPPVRGLPGFHWRTKNTPDHQNGTCQWKRKDYSRDSHRFHQRSVSPLPGTRQPLPVLMHVVSKSPARTASELSLRAVVPIAPAALPINPQGMVLAKDSSPRL